LYSKAHGLRKLYNVAQLPHAITRKTSPAAFDLQAPLTLKSVTEKDMKQASE